MSRAPALAATALIVAAACSGPRIDDISLTELIARAEAPEAAACMVFLWAPWSRQSLELAPSFHELAAEYRLLDVASYSVCVDARQACDEAILTLPEDSFLRLEEPFSEALERLGVSDLPAVLTYDSKGKLFVAMSGAGSIDGLRPEDIADAVDSVLAPSN